MLHAWLVFSFMAGVYLAKVHIHCCESTTKFGAWEFPWDNICWNEVTLSESMFQRVNKNSFTSEKCQDKLAAHYIDNSDAYIYTL